MHENRVNIKKRISLIKKIVVMNFLVFMSLYIMILFVKFKYYVTAYGNIDSRIEILVKSGFSGVINKVFVHEGQTIKANQVLLEVKDDIGHPIEISSTKSGEFVFVDLEKLEHGKRITKDQIIGLIVEDVTTFRANVDERDILDIKEGQGCFIRIWGTYKGNEDPLEGTVTYISDIPTTKQKKTYYDVYCQLRNNGGAEKNLLVGMSGRAKICIGKYTLFDELLGRRRR